MTGPRTRRVRHLAAVGAQVNAATLAAWARQCAAAGRTADATCWQRLAAERYETARRLTGVGAAWEDEVEDCG